MPDEIKFYADENVSGAVVNGLRIRGVDVLTTKEANMLGVSDKRVLKFAKNENYVIFTHDSDFLKLDAANVTHNGIVILINGHQLATLFAD